jgi:hypothetical protein
MWVYDEKFLSGMQFLLGTLSFMVRNNNLVYPTQEQEERRTTMIGFEFHRGLKNSATMFQPAVRQPTMTNSIDNLTRLPIETPSMTTRSFGLALGEIRTTKPEESV